MRSIQSDCNLPGELRIWAWDGFKANQRRRNIFPDYKVRRKPAPNEFYKTIEQIKKMIQHTNALQIEVEGYEADDVIATIVASWPRTEPVHIMSTDRDLQPLRLLPNVTTSQTNKPGVMPHEVQLYKTLVGDSSDSIPGLPGFGEKSWERCNKVQMKELIFGQRDRLQVEGLSSRTLNWLADVNNLKLLRSMWNCIALLDVPQDQITRNLRPGVRDDVAAMKIMSEFLQ